MALVAPDAPPQTAAAPPSPTTPPPATPPTPPSTPSTLPTQPAQPAQPAQLSLEEFGQKIKAKHPEYSDLDDRAVGQKVIAKYPQYQDMIKPDAPPQPGFLQNLQNKADASVSATSPSSVVPVTDPAGTFKGSVERLRQGLAQGAESVVVHPSQTAHSSIELPMDMLRATGWNPNPFGKPLSDDDVHAAQDRIKAQWDAARANPYGAAGQLIGGGLVTHGLSEVTGGIVRGGLKAAGSTADALLPSPKGVAENVSGVTTAVEKAGEKQVAATQAANESNAAKTADYQQSVQDAQKTANEKNAMAKAQYAQDVKDAQEAAGTANDTAQKQMLRQYVKNQKVADQRNALSQANYESQTEADKLNHANKVTQIQLQNEAAEKTAADQTAQNSTEAQQKYQENVQAAQDTESERGELARQEIQTRLALMRRVQAVAKQAKSAVNSQYGEVRAGVTGAIDSGKVSQPPWSTFQDTVEAAKDSLQGSQQKIPIFQSILKRADDVGNLESQRRAIMDSRNIPGNSYEDLSPEHKALVNEAVADNQALRDSGGVPIEGEEGTPTASYDHLRGYSSEIGRELRNNPDMDGDIKYALIKVKAHLDAMSQNMANKAGVGAKLQSANKNWAIYKDVFHENTGPSGSGSPVAKSLKAEDATNATEPFLNKDAEIASRARQLLVGQPFRGPGSYFDPGAGYLVDKLRDIRSKVEALPKNPVEVPPYEEPEPVQPKLKPVPDESSIPVRAVPKQAQPTPVAPKDTVLPKEVPTPNTVLPKQVPQPELKEVPPLDIEKIKRDAIVGVARKYRTLQPWQVRMLALSTAGGLFAQVLGHSGVSEYGGIGGVVTALAPRVLSSLIDLPTFRNWIARGPTGQDLSVLTKIPDSDLIRLKDATTGQVVSLAQAGEKLKISPKTQDWLGVGNMRTIAKAIANTKGTGSERIKEGARGAVKTGVAAAGAVGAQQQATQQSAQAAPSTLTTSQAGTAQNPLNRYPNPEEEPPEQSYARNAKWAKPGPYFTKLSPEDEAKFQQWVKTNNVNWREGEKDYDMRGFWKELSSGHGDVRTEMNSVDHKLHYSDKYKTPYSGVFGNESKYALPHAPHWEGKGDAPTLVTYDGKIVVPGSREKGTAAR